MTYTGMYSKDYSKTSVGFDEVFNRVMGTSLADASASNYPPYNLYKITDNEYRIDMALAGFNLDEIEVTLKEDVLKIEYKPDESATEADVKYFHRGIAKRAFRRVFALSDTLVVKGATMENGILSIDMENIIPEHRRPRKIEITTKTQKVESKTDGEPISVNGAETD